MVSFGGTSRRLQSALISPGGDITVDNGHGVVIGNKSQVATSASGIPELQVLGTAPSDTREVVGRWSADADGPQIVGVKSRNATIGSSTVVQDNDVLLDIVSNGDDGTDFQAIAALIRMAVDGTPGTGDMPGSISFLTTADGAESPTERVQINAAGNTVFSGYAVLLITDTDAAVEGALWYDASENKLKFYNGASVETITSA